MNVVFPAPVPPATITLKRASTIALRRWKRGSLMVPRSMSCLSRWMSKSWRRMEMDGRPETQAMALSRSPEGSCRSRRGLARVPAVFGAASARRRLDEFDEMLVRVGHGFALSLQAVAVGDPHGVVAVDDDVGDRRVVDVLLDPAECEQLVEHRSGDCASVALVDGGFASPDLLGVKTLEFVSDQLASEHPAVLTVDRSPFMELRLGNEFGEPFADDLPNGFGRVVAGRHALTPFRSALVEDPMPWLSLSECLGERRCASHEG